MTASFLAAITFLDPWTGVLAASLGVPALIALYLLKLRRRPLRISSTLLWTRAAHDLEVNAPFRWLRSSWLLVLHLLALLLLCAAAARPSLSAGDAGARALVLVLDCSASMSARPAADTPTRLDRAKASALDLAERVLAADGSSVAVIAFAAEPRIVLAPTGSRGAVRAAIDSIAPTDQPGNPEPALRLAGSILPESDTAEAEDAAPRAPTIVLVSDRRPTLTEAPAFAGCSFVSAADAGPPPLNAGVIALAVQRQYADPANVRVFARVLSNAPVPGEIAVQLLVDGSPVAARAALPAEPPSGGPATATVTFDLVRTAAAIISVALPGGDALPADDVASAYLPGASRPRVLLIRPPSTAQSADDPATPEWFLAEALPEMDIASFRSASSDDWDMLASIVSESFDLVVFDRFSPPTLPGVPSLSFASAPPGLGVEWRPGAAADAEPVGVLSWDRDDPLLRDVSLDGLRYRAAGSLVPGAEARVIARGPDGPLIVAAAAPTGQRHAFVAFPPHRSNWPTHLSFPIFLANVIDVLTLRVEQSAGAFTTTADTVSVPAPPGSGLTLEGPATLRAAALADAPGAPVSLGIPPRAGVYTVVPSPAAAPPVVAVNLLAPEETSLASAAPDAGPTLDSSPQAPPIPRELWMPLTLLALVLLTAEWFLYAIRARV